MPLLLTESDVRRVLPMDDLIEAMGSALAAFSARQVVQPLRAVLPVGTDRSFFGVMPAYLTPHPDPVLSRRSASSRLTRAAGGASGERERGALGVKLVMLFPGNAARGLPTHLATMALFDPDTGALEALLDGRYITEARTAAVSAVATRHLAVAKPASVLAILGSGVQARSHVEALPRVRDVAEVRVWSPNADRRERFAEEMRQATGLPIRAADGAEAAVRDADIVALVTGAMEPVVRNEWIRDGAHLVGVGACRPDQREMDPRLVARARLVVDSREAALAEAGDVVMAIAEGHFTAEHIAGELGDIVAGRIAGRRSDGEVTIFKSLGMAVEDVAAARLACERARLHGIGQTIDLADL